jgi:hypothetical protein
MTPFFRGDDDVCEHRKFKRAGLDATGLYWLSVAYASKYLTDGHIDLDYLEDRVPSKAKREKLVAALVEQRLFEPNGNGFVIHDFHDYNPTAEEVLTKRRARAEAGRRGGEASGRARGSKR